MTDTEILQWLEGMHTLHIAVEALYVVDGYQVRVVYDGDEFSPAYWGETLAAAYCKCAEEWDGGRRKGRKGEAVMGNNAAFTAFEATVIAVYNKGALDRELLSEFMEQYRGVDIDSGGRVGTLAKDGLEIEDIVLKTFGKEVPGAPDLPKNYKTWTPEQEQLNLDYRENRFDAFREITNQFGWH